MTLDRIGWWVTTQRGTRWHLIESEIGMDVVTRCGRRLRDGTADISPPVEDKGLCVYCSEFKRVGEGDTLDHGTGDIREDEPPTMNTRSDYP